MSHSSLRDRDPLRISCSASFSCSCAGPCSLSSLTVQSEFFLYFFFCIGATDTGTVWFLVSAMVSVAGDGAAAVPASEAGAAPAVVALACWLVGLWQPPGLEWLQSRLGG